MYLEIVANGLFLGAIYALFAVPMSVVWVTTDVIDVSIGAYAVLAGVVAAVFGLPYGGLLGIAAAMALGAVTGAIFLGFHALRTMKDAMPIVLATFALLLFVESALLVAVGTDNQFVERVPGIWLIGDSVIGRQGLFNLACSVVLMLALTAVLKWSPAGLRMKACAISAKNASLAGIPVKRTQFLTFVLCAGIAGSGGVLASMSIGMTYASAFTFTTIAFGSAVVLGRRGPLPAFLGGLLIGLAESVSEAFLPNGWAPAVPAVLIIVVLASGRMPTAAFSGARP
ncbi:MAG: branched-chain amino acid ABC transporter permease [Rhodopseudomonas palustris]|uniref:Branched-chain amino acid ABC transporter permease n=1 Tax=Rhodopseudomonas palustris TaxID=1076 RepID=A0A933RU04_RHOPL|nr:branched-chain amino acid ABC transporter permease [Rhodopseudomonas palustris]